MAYVETSTGSVVLLYILIWFGVGGGIGAAIGSSKGRATLGFFLGLFLGFIGWIIVAVMEPSAEQRLIRTSELAQVLQNPQINQQRTKVAADRACPWCAEFIKPAAIVCRFCGRDIPRMQMANNSNSSPESETELTKWLRDTNPRWAEEALEIFRSRQSVVMNPRDWLNELCSRLANGSDGRAAADKIPLDFPNNQ